MLIVGAESIQVDTTAGRLTAAGKTLKDCLAAADFLRTVGWVDGDRLGIFGASYGSYLALLSVTDDPECRFRCAVCKYGDCDALTTWAQGDRAGRLVASPDGRAVAEVSGSGQLADGTNTTVIQQLRIALKKIARSQAPVFITGESGTGKEVVANLVHRLSNRSEGPFIAINCGAIPTELMESELFGHKKGAFTDAKEDRVGRFEADGR